MLIFCVSFYKDIDYGQSLLLAELNINVNLC